MRLCLVIAFMGSCLSNASPTKKLTDTVYETNDKARWGRIGQAAMRTTPGYRQAFMESHRGWGSRIQIADTEVLNLQFAQDGDVAVATVTYSWYALDTMTLHASVVRQRWEASEEFYGLAGEEVVQAHDAPGDHDQESEQQDIDQVFDGSSFPVLSSGRTCP